MRFDYLNNTLQFDNSIRNKIEQIDKQIEEDRMNGYEEEIKELQLARYYEAMKLGNSFDVMHRRGIPY